MAHQDCRFYESRYPEMDDVVMVQVKSIAEMGAYVSLLEYGGIEGMILLSELSRRRIRSVQKLIKVGRQEPVMVLRVDKEKGYIDLSKRRVNPEDVAKCEERFAKSRMVHSIMRHVAETCGVELDDLYSQVGWPLYRLYGHAYDAFRGMIPDPEPVLERLRTEVHSGETPAVLTPAVLDGILKNIKRRMTPQPIKIRADVEMTCFAYDGVEHIKGAMRAALAQSSEECEVSIKLVAPPLYVLTTQTLDKARGIEVLTAAVEACKASVEAQRGSLRVKEAARAVSEKEEKLLQEELEAAEAANREIAGDDESEEDFEEGMSVDVDAAPALAIITNAPTRCHVPVRRIDSTEIHECAMQTVCVSPSVGLRPVRSSGRSMMVCRAQAQPAQKRVALGGLVGAAVALPSLLATHPALALVDERLNGDGTGQILGINDASLFWVLAIVFGLVWAAYYNSQRDLGGDKGDDSGLTL
ncbi:Eukaryotic translation initiation factor 2 subunit alpha [Auxenochlorella protothecoides]|uniref:PSII 6.1 kDa protein n=1 Tax=Auxenochlorella protothecoides TaxID=3075 RepID=A0A087SED8_AUXPR|nr:Eukaryotic translation initiation factor 2 subunit alpha [Auxenochlorella protothecoides]KFM24092.1 Eukaryotic translation initiation factor 2 subunit alpha [Auxenochlorella protothecoides]